MIESGTGTEVGGGGNTVPHPSASKGRNFAFTSFVGKIEYNENKMKYLIQGEETCPVSGREHWQGCVIFKNPRSLKGVIQEYKKVHFEMCVASVEMNKRYCKKEGKWEEYGCAPVGAGKRTDVQSLISQVKSGMSDKDILEGDQGGAWLRVYKGVATARSILFEVKRFWVMDVRIYWGPPGCGKTRKVYEEYGDRVYSKMDGKWFDGYQGEEVLLVDDFNPGSCMMSFEWWLKLLDRYPMRVEYKGGSREFSSKVLIFTSNQDPIEWYEGYNNRDAFFRRVSKIEFMG